jgi:hypothetical protein
MTKAVAKLRAIFFKADDPGSAACVLFNKSKK